MAQRVVGSLARGLPGTRTRSCNPVGRRALARSRFLPVRRLRGRVSRVTSIRRSESSARTPAGLWLFQRAWLPAPGRSGEPQIPDAQCALLLVHGLAEHSGRYEHVASWFAARGCAVYAYDQRGHGRSDGERCHVRRFGEYLDDLETVLTRVRNAHPELPIFLLGHSMGGLVVAAFLAERGPAVAGAVTTGAALAISARLAGPRLLAARLARGLLPRLRVPIGIDPGGLSRDAEVVRAYVEDPLVERRVSVSLAVELARASRRTLDLGSRIGVPMLLLHGEEDPVCSPLGTAGLQATLLVPGTRLRSYPSLRHEILNEPERSVVLQDIFEWLRSRQKGGGG